MMNMYSFIFTKSLSHNATKLGIYEIWTLQGFLCEPAGSVERGQSSGTGLWAPPSLLLRLLSWEAVWTSPAVLLLASVSGQHTGTASMMCSNNRLKSRKFSRPPSEQTKQNDIAILTFLTKLIHERWLFYL